jgi:GntR family transcriptional regulator/MocR family aminotransferase
MVPLALHLRRSSDASLYRQLYDELRDAILTRRLANGARLPSTRDMASELGVSRNTVMGAFEQLLAEGYLEGKVGSGTYVAHTLPDELLSVRQTVLKDRGAEGPGAGLSRRGAVMAGTQIIPPRRHSDPRPFRPSPPSSDLFPWKLWGNLLAKRWKSAGAGLLSYGESLGYQPLREAIAAYVKSARAVRCDPRQVVVVAGSQQGLDFTARLLLDPGDRVFMEDPGYLGARGAFVGAGASVIPVPIDAEGMNFAAAPGKARLVYVTPSHQFPMGVTMSLARRLALLEWAGRNGAWIIEDDYNSEYRYSGRPAASLQGLDVANRVIYIGTFSKVLFPSLRIGYLVLPPDLVDAFAAARALSDLHSPTLEQAVVTDFINEGHFARHLRRMRTVYEERQSVLVESVKRELDGFLDVEKADAGMHILGWLPKGTGDREITLKARAAGVEAPALSSYAMIPPERPGLLLGYTAFTPREIRAGVRKFRTAIA